MILTMRLYRADNEIATLHEPAWGNTFLSENQEYLVEAKDGALGFVRMKDLAPLLFPSEPTGDGTMKPEERGRG